MALSVLPGIGGVGGAKLAAEKAMGILKIALAEAVQKLKDVPQLVYKVVTNVEVDENAIL